MKNGDALPARELVVPAAAAKMRLDRFLSRWFTTRSRAELVRGIRAGLVLDERGRPLRASSPVRGGQVLHIRLAGLAPSGPPPPLPPILFEDRRVLAMNKPAGMLAHPVGNAFAYALIGLAREHWPADDIDLVHRLDRDTSGILLLSKDVETNRLLKEAIKGRAARKEYLALCRGEIPWDERTFEGPIGSDGGVIRIKMAVRPDGLSARTGVRVLERGVGTTRVAIRLHTGRTHQIRVHLSNDGFPLVGDRMYGVAPEVFLRAWEHGVDDAVIAEAGAPRQALHAWRLAVPHPDGGELELEAPEPEDMRRWWEHPEVLPFDRTPPATGVHEEDV